MTTNSFTTPLETELAYTDLGSGQPIMLLHGLSFDRQMWVPAIEYLGQNYRCIAVDLPGHGNSSDRHNYDLEEIATELHELAEYLDLQQLIIIGHGLGAILATVYASSYPVALVVNIDQPLYLSPFIDLLRGMKSELIGDNFLATFSRIVSSPAIECIPVRDLEPICSQPRQDVVLGYWAILLDSTPTEIEALISAKLRTIAAPYFAIHRAPVADFYRGWLSQQLKKLEILVIPDGDRFPQLTDPESFASEIDRVASKTQLI